MKTRFIVEADLGVIAQNIQEKEVASIVAEWELEEAEAAKKKKMVDHKSKYGNVEYADPKNHKYPINTKSRVLSAIRYINMPKNQKGYTAAEVAEIKKNIRSKFKQYGIDEDGDDKGKSKK